MWVGTNGTETGDGALSVIDLNTNTLTDYSDTSTTPSLVDNDISCVAVDGADGNPVMVGTEDSGVTVIIEGDWEIDPDLSTLEAFPITLAADGEATSTITVTLRDGNNDPVPGKEVEISATGTTITVTQPVSATDASGQAVGYVRSTKAQTSIVSARDVTDDVTLAQTASITFTAGLPDADISTLVVTPTLVLANGTDVATATVTLLDQFANPVPGKEVALLTDGQAVTVTLPVTLTDASGQVTGTIRSTTAQTVTVQALDVTDNITLTETAELEFTRDLVIDQNTTWETGMYEFDNLTVTNNAVLTLKGDTTTSTGVTIHAQNITVDAEAEISADGQGYGADTSPGDLGEGGTGGGHGGYGGIRSGWTIGGAPYSNPYRPTDLGSGGRTQAGGGGTGGGAIHLVVSDALTVDGTISANGGEGGYGWDGGGGGGAGGSIWIETASITGTGTIQANGGAGGCGAQCESHRYGGGGAGGRIALYYSTKTVGSIQAYGGGGYQYGGPGTIYEKDTTTNQTQLIFDNNSHDGARSLLSLGTDVDDLALRNGAYINFEAVTPITPSYSIGNLTLENNAIAYFLGNTADDMGVEIVG